jgi:hypothetical protein
MPVIYAKRRREQALSSLLACVFDQLKLHRGATMLQYSMIFEKQQNLRSSLRIRPGISLIP